MNNTFKKSFTLFLILTILLFSLSGCYNQNSIDKLAYVVAIGLDNGENNKLKLSFQISVPGSSSQERWFFSVRFFYCYYYRMCHFQFWC